MKRLSLASDYGIELGMKLCHGVVNFLLWRCKADHRIVKIKVEHFESNLGVEINRLFLFALGHVSAEDAGISICGGRGSAGQGESECRLGVGSLDSARLVCFFWCVFSYLGRSVGGLRNSGGGKRRRERLGRRARACRV